MARVLLAVWLLVLPLGCTRANTAPPKPNVLLISIDSLRADHLGAYGYERATSPEMDRLAREGATFLNAQAPSPWTLPSHATLLTGQPPEIHGAYRHDLALNDRAVTLAESIRDLGYRTAGFVSGPFLRSMYGFDQGFDVYDESTVGTPDTVRRAATSPNIERLATEWIGRSLRKHPDTPFFVFLHMWDPHHDHLPPPRLRAEFDPGYDGPAAEVHVESDRVWAGMPRRDLEHVISMYDAEIRFTDEHIGRIIDFLRTHGVLDDTIVVVTSDHGEEFFEHGDKTHAKSLFEEVLRIPLIVRYPRSVSAGTKITQQVRLMDVPRTVLGLAGSDVSAIGTNVASPHRDHDLSPWITGARDLDTFPELLAFGQTTTNGILNSARNNDLKVIVERPHGRGRGRERVLVYDLSTDRGEVDNLWPEAISRRDVRQLMAEATGWKRILKKNALPPTPFDLEKDQVERLRALGYVE